MMSWSLGLHNGDLVLSGTSLGTVTGAQKLAQDLRCALLEPMGTDPLYPGFGSIIDGGTQPDGTFNPGYLGTTNWSFASMAIEAEIRRICNEYQSRQLARAQSDRMTYRKTLFDPGEVLISVESVSFIQIGDTLVAQVVIEAGDTTQVTLNLPLTSSPVITS